MLGDLQRRFTPGAAATVGVVSDNRDLLQSLTARKFFRLEPAAAVVALDEEAGKWPAMTHRQGALIKWLLQSMAYWEVRYPLASELREHLGALLPALALRALEDEGFTRPGSHPAHRVLDTLQSEAVGWQPGMGRAGDTLYRSLVATIESLHRALEEGDAADLATLAERVAHAAEAEKRRNARMIQRLVEKEQGHHKTTAARSRAAQMINDMLSRHSLPAPVGRFVKGPWYESAQLVLLKFGPDAAEWQQMARTTERLAQSLQPQALDAEEEDSRKQVLARIKGLPGELRRYLLKLQHDDEAISEAIGLIEFAHLRLLRQQPLQLYPVEPLPVEGDGKPESGVPGSIARLAVGQWFLLQREAPRDTVRVQLALKLDAQQSLLFNNRAGMKACLLGYAEFDRALSQKTARELHSGGSFSLCLLRAAGITTAEQLQALGGGTGTRSVAPEPAAPEPVAPEPATPEPATPEPATPEPAAPEPATPKHEEESLEIELFEAAPDAADFTAPGDGPAPLAGEDDDLPPELDLTGVEIGEETWADPPSDAGPGEEALDLALGTWLGFHDCDPPLLARLAAHDRDLGMYIFVNRRGLKLRQLNNAELLDLAERDLVDIFDPPYRFRDHVGRLKSDTPNQT